MGGERAGTVLVALDTRPTGPRLVSAAMAGIRAAGAAVVGSEDTLRTTPQLHWQVLANQLHTLFATEWTGMDIFFCK